MKIGHSIAVFYWRRSKFEFFLQSHISYIFLTVSFYESFLAQQKKNLPINLTICQKGKTDRQLAASSCLKPQLFAVFKNLDRSNFYPIYFILSFQSLFNILKALFVAPVPMPFVHFLALHAQLHRNFSGLLPGPIHIPIILLLEHNPLRHSHPLNLLFQNRPPFEANNGALMLFSLFLDWFWRSKGRWVRFFAERRPARAWSLHSYKLSSFSQARHHSRRLLRGLPHYRLNLQVHRLLCLSKCICEWERALLNQVRDVRILYCRLKFSLCLLGLEHGLRSLASQIHRKWRFKVRELRLYYLRGRIALCGNVHRVWS